MEKLSTRNGEYVLITRRGGSLYRDAPARFCACAEGGAELIYADEVIKNANGGSRMDFKPADSPDTLFSIPYIGSPVAVAKRVYDALEPPWDDSDEAVADFTLRAHEAVNGVMHIPEALFCGPQQKPFDYHRCVQRALERRGVRAQAVRGLYEGSCCVRYGVPPRTEVAVIVPFIGDIDAVRKTMESLERTSTFERCAFYVPYGRMPDPRAERYLTELQNSKAARVLCLPGRLAAHELKNDAAKRASERLLLFLDAGVTLCSHDGIERLAEYALLSHTAAVGAKIVSNDGKLLHTGFVPGAGLLPGVLFYGHDENAKEALFDRYVTCVRNVSAVGGGVLMIERDRFLSSRGFDETTPAYAADAELCLRATQGGTFCVYQPYARFRREKTAAPQPAKDEAERLRDAFFAYMERGDPMLSENPELIKHHWAKPN